MKAFVNWPIFKQTSLDSSSLTMLGTVLHKFSELGEYMGTILQKEDAVGTFQLTVDKECPAMQVNIDLATPHRPTPEKWDSETRKRFVVNPNGFALFYVSHGWGGYAVLVGRLGEKIVPELVFDSRELQEEDVFAVTMIRPGTYSVTNINTDAKGKIVVTYPKIREVPYRPSKPVNIECTKKALCPSEIRIGPAQGQVYQIRTPSRIKIELIEPDDGPATTDPEEN